MATKRRLAGWAICAALSGTLGCGSGGGGGGGGPGGQESILTGTYALAEFQVSLSEETASFPLGGFTGMPPSLAVPEATATELLSVSGNLTFDGSGGLGGTTADTSALFFWDEVPELASGSVSAPGCDPVFIAGGVLPRNGFELTTDSGGGTASADYTISGDGVLRIEADETLAGAVDPNGLLAAVGSYDAVAGRAGVSVLVKRSAPNAPASFSGTYHFASIRGGLELGANPRTLFGSSSGTLVATGTTSGTFAASSTEHEISRTIGETQGLAVAPVTFPCGSGSATVTVWSDDLAAPETSLDAASPSGTFLVDADGGLTVNAGEVLTGVLGEGGTFAVLNDDRDETDAAGRGFLLFVQAPSGLDPTPLSGEYRFVSLEAELTGEDRVTLSSGVLTFTTAGIVSLSDGEERKVTRQFGGGFGNAALAFSVAHTGGGSAGSSVTKVTVTAETDSSGASAGTYTVTPDGLVTITLSGDDPITGFVSPDLGTLVVPLGGGGSAGMGLAFKKP